MSSTPREQAPCRHFGTCGGCAFQDWAYERHLAAKAEAVARAFEQAGVPAALAEPCPAVERWFYRNRMSYIVGPGPVVGLREPGRWDAIVDVRECLLLSEPGQRLVDAFRDFVGTRRLEPYDRHTHRGLVRYLVVREGKNTGDRLAIAVAARAADFPFADFAALARENGCTAAALAINGAQSDVSSGEIVSQDGAPLVEWIAGRSFEIGPTSFFQPNTRMAERLVEVVDGLLGAGGGRLLDLYAGVGLFAISLHERFREVVAVEADPSSARDAVRNAARNGAANVTVIEGEVERALADIGGDSAVLDPPRAGLRAAALRALLASPLATLVYVSCNPASMARDIAAMRGAFRLDGPVHVLDSLPWTKHAEAAARLVRG